MDELWETIKERWEDDAFFREQIILAVVIGSIGLAFTIAECYAKVGISA